MNAEQVAGTEAKLDAFERAGWPLAWAAYGLATSYHETAHTMQPVAEYGRGRGRKYGIRTGPYNHIYYGRGDVQLTWLRNYEVAGRAIGVDLVKYPDLALDPAVSARIMIEGMAQGWFTGRRNSHYLDSDPPNYVDARRIINGTDRAQMIAGYARTFEAALRKAGYDGKPDAPAAPVRPKAPVRGTNPPAKPLGAQNPVPATNAPAPRKGLWARFLDLMKGRAS